MSPGRSGVDWAAADGRSGPDRSGAERCVPCVWREQLRRLISPHALLLPAALTKSGCSENMFPALKAEAQHPQKETNRDERREVREAEWDKWSGTSKGENFGRKEEKVKSGLGKWFFAPTGALQLVGLCIFLNDPTFCLQTVSGVKT